MSQAKKKSGKKMPKPDYKWIVLIFILTMLISGTMSFISSELLGRADLAVSFLILIGIILIGIIFDIIGVAVTSAEEKPFHSMASRKVPEAAKALSGRSANPLIELLMSALVAALTVGGKAFGKTFAIHMSTSIVQTTAKVLTFFKTLPAKLRGKRRGAEKRES